MDGKIANYFSIAAIGIGVVLLILGAYMLIPPTVSGPCGVDACVEAGMAYQHALPISAAITAIGIVLIGIGVLLRIRRQR